MSVDENNESIKFINSNIKEKGIIFENFAYEYLSSIFNDYYWYKTKNTSPFKTITGDFGIDLWGISNNSYIFVQCKCYSIDKNIKWEDCSKLLACGYNFIQENTNINPSNNIFVMFTTSSKISKKFGVDIYKNRKFIGFNDIKSGLKKFLIKNENMLNLDENQVILSNNLSLHLNSNNSCTIIVEKTKINKIIGEIIRFNKFTRIAVFGCGVNKKITIPITKNEDIKCFSYLKLEDKIEKINIFSPQLIVLYESLDMESNEKFVEFIKNKEKNTKIISFSSKYKKNGKNFIFQLIYNKKIYNLDNHKKQEIENKLLLYRQTKDSKTLTLKDIKLLLEIRNIPYNDKNKKDSLLRLL